MISREHKSQENLQYFLQVLNFRDKVTYIFLFPGVT